ncbi:MAG: hypothetical protein E6Q76_08200 [Rhizobium sp.]|nr:MAG: hypothetical protein E6Q76_08200 [Rhizobium sp.]
MTKLDEQQVQSFGRRASFVAHGRAREGWIMPDGTGVVIVGGLLTRYAPAQVSSVGYRHKVGVRIDLAESVHGALDHGVVSVGYVHRSDLGYFGIVLGNPAPVGVTAEQGMENAIQFWRDQFSKASLERRFESETVGGMAVRFLLQKEKVIVAQVSGPKDVEILHFHLDGGCTTRLGDDRYTLVPRNRKAA